MPEISIIVPVYNVEKYLDKCLRSILAQTFTDFELILIDDGSTDSSGAMCDQYARQDSRIRVIHKANGGLSSARNAGIEAAKGNYLGFVDSDDYIESDMYEQLYSDLKKEDANIAICGVYSCYEGRPFRKRDPALYFVMDRKEAIKGYLEEIFGASVCNKLFEKRIFKTLRFPVGKNYEDGFVVADVLMHCDRVVFSGRPKYYYVHREDSITTAHSAANALDCICSYKRSYESICENYPELEGLALQKLCSMYHQALCQMLFAADRKQYRNEENEVTAFLRDNLKIVLKSNATIFRKMSALVLCANKSLYRLSVLMWNKCFRRLMGRGNADDT